jgi:hypothetical protein
VGFSFTSCVKLVLESFRTLHGSKTTALTGYFSSIKAKLTHAETFLDNIARINSFPSSLKWFSLTLPESTW